MRKRLARQARLLLSSKLLASRSRARARVDDPGRFDTAARWLIAGILFLITAAALGKSWHNNVEWADAHRDGGGFGWTFPAVIDLFIVAGELTLYVGAVRAWTRREQWWGWLMALGGLAVSTASNFGYLGPLARATDRATNAVYPAALGIALAAALAVLRRVRTVPAQDVGRAAASADPAARPTRARPAPERSPVAGPARDGRAGPFRPEVLARYMASVENGAPLSQRDLAGECNTTTRQARNAIDEANRRLLAKVGGNGAGP